MTRPVHVSVSHPNRLFRECLVSVLSDVPQFEVSEVDHAAGGYLELIEAQPPDVLLVGLHLPGQKAVEFARHVRQNLTTTKVLLLARGNSEESLYECFGAGVHGCVLEESSLAGLQGAIEAVVRGETFCSPQLVYAMFQRLSETARRSRWQDCVQSLEVTPREMEIVHLIAERLSNKEIAKRLSLSLYTVKNHVHNIVEKLHVEDRFEAVEYARKRGWLTAGAAAIPFADGR